MELQHRLPVLRAINAPKSKYPHPKLPCFGFRTGNQLPDDVITNELSPPSELSQVLCVLVFQLTDISLPDCVRNTAQT
jgi:hypothetical protein